MKEPLFNNILVYLDGTEGSLNALMYAILLAKETSSSLTALYVINSKALQDLLKSHVFITSEREEYEGELEKDAERHLRHAEKLALKKDLEIKCVKKEGSPNDVVLSYVKENDINLLVLGSVNSIRSRREELTTESDRIMRTSFCPVLVVKDDYDLWEEF